MNYTNKVFSFFVNLHGDASIKFSTETKELLDYWKSSWSKHGWEPIVMSEADIGDHEYYNKLKFNNFYESNLCKLTVDFDCEYTRCCYMRWLAFHVACQKYGTICWADSDVMNYGLSPEQSHHMGINKVFAPEFCAGIMNFTGSKYILDNFIDVESGKHDIKDVSPKDHSGVISDMFILTHLVSWRGQAPQKRLCWITENKEWLKSKLVHYDNGIFSRPEYKEVLNRDGKKMSRLEAIKTLEEIREKDG